MQSTIPGVKVGGGGRSGILAGCSSAPHTTSACNHGRHAKLLYICSYVIKMFF